MHWPSIDRHVRCVCDPLSAARLDPAINKLCAIAHALEPLCGWRDAKIHKKKQSAERHRVKFCAEQVAGKTLYNGARTCTAACAACRDDFMHGAALDEILRCSCKPQRGLSE